MLFFFVVPYHHYFCLKLYYIITAIPSQLITNYLLMLTYKLPCSSPHIVSLQVGEYPTLWTLLFVLISNGDNFLCVFRSSTGKQHCMSPGSPLAGRPET